MTLEQARAHVGELVLYKAGTEDEEDGVITSMNDRFAFVWFAGTCAAKATDPADLTLYVSAP